MAPEGKDIAKGEEGELGDDERRRKAREEGRRRDEPCLISITPRNESNKGRFRTEMRILESCRAKK